MLRVIRVHLQLGEIPSRRRPGSSSRRRPWSCRCRRSLPTMIVRPSAETKGLPAMLPSGRPPCPLSPVKLIVLGEGVGYPDQPLAAGDVKASLVRGVARPSNSTRRSAPGFQVPRCSRRPIRRSRPRWDQSRSTLIPAVDDSQPRLRPARSDACSGVGHGRVRATAAVGDPGDDARSEGHAAIGRGVEALVGPVGGVAAAHIAEDAQRVDGIDRYAQALETVEPEASRQVPTAAMVA